MHTNPSAAPWQAPRGPSVQHETVWFGACPAAKVRVWVFACLASLASRAGKKRGQAPSFRQGQRKGPKSDGNSEPAPVFSHHLRGIGSRWRKDMQKLHPSREVGGRRPRLRPVRG